LAPSAKIAAKREEVKPNEFFQRSAALAYPPWQDLGDLRNSGAVGPSQFSEISDGINNK